MNDQEEAVPGPPGVVHVPDGAPPPVALARTTDLAVVAHPDDLELLMIPAIASCADDPARWFTGIVCTDGSGGVIPGGDDAAEPAVLVRTRAEEQQRAADLGGYSAVVLLGHDSGAVRSSAGAGLVDQVADLLRLASPVNLWTHDLCDAHPTHVAVGVAAVAACRRVPLADRPVRAVGVEGWRSLDWLGPPFRVAIDASGTADLAHRLGGVFVSQLGSKNYLEALRGRRLANATLADPYAADTHAETVLAMELTPLVRNDDLDVGRYVDAALAQHADTCRELLARPDRLG